MQELARYPVRTSGFSVRLKFVQPLSNLTIAEQAFAALLRTDAEMSNKLIPMLGDSDYKQLIELIVKSQFASLIFDRICLHGLLEIIDFEFRDELKRLSFKEIAAQKLVSRRHLDLLKELSLWSDRILWIKGSSLRYTAYEKPYYRHSGDVDLLVHLPELGAVVRHLQNSGYYWCSVPSDCNQIECGPAKSVDDLFLSPGLDWIPTSAISLFKENFPQVDLKVGPFDSGIQMFELQRLFRDAASYKIGDFTAFAPNSVDHLILLIHNLVKDKFTSWKTLFDVHVLLVDISKTPKLWDVFLKRAQIEGMTHFCWAGLTLAVDRFASPIPPQILSNLAPKPTLLNRFFLFSASTAFVWNSTSLMMLLCNAIVSENCNRKMSALRSAFLPNQEFLQNYYNRRHPAGIPQTFILLLLHWAVLVLPGGLIRRTFGRYVWRIEATTLSTKLE